MKNKHFGILTDTEIERTSIVLGAIGILIGIGFVLYYSVKYFIDLI